MVLWHLAFRIGGCVLSRGFSFFQSRHVSDRLKERTTMRTPRTVLGRYSQDTYKVPNIVLSFCSPLLSCSLIHLVTRLTGPAHGGVDIVRAHEFAKVDGTHFCVQTTNKTIHVIDRRPMVQNVHSIYERLYGGRGACAQQQEQMLVSKAFLLYNYVYFVCRFVGKCCDR